MKAMIRHETTTEIELPDEFNQYTSLINMYEDGDTTLSNKGKDFVEEILRRIDSYCMNDPRINEVIDFDVCDPDLKDGYFTLYEDGGWVAW